MNRKPLVYIAGPISIGDQFQNVRNAMDTWDAMQASGIEAFCPHWSVLQQMHKGRGYEFWIEYCFRILSRCDAVYRMPGESVGGDAEVELARFIGLPVFYDHEWGKLVDWNCDLCERGEEIGRPGQGTL